ncbi:MAG TPA: hypothetical protein VL943_02345 [Niabella sp.]|nr:hypothetical protein [Niabella sp.]
MSTIVLMMPHAQTIKYGYPVSFPGSYIYAHALKGANLSIVDRIH